MKQRQTQTTNDRYKFSEYDSLMSNVERAQLKKPINFYGRFDYL